MLRIYISISLAVFLVTVTGCTHNIQMSPTLDRIHIAKAPQKINKRVGYYISSQNKNQTIIMPAGAGDSVSYKPYKDTEAALNTILSKIFDRVYSVKSLNNKEYIQKKDISYIFIPKLITKSKSEDGLTWVPTHFTIELSCKAINAEGKQIWSKDVKAIGGAQFSEYSGDFSLAARRASARAYVNLMNEISQAGVF